MSESVEKLKSENKRLRGVIDTAVYVKTQCWCGADSKGNPTPKCVHCFLKAALAGEDAVDVEAGE